MSTVKKSALKSAAKGQTSNLSSSSNMKAGKSGKAAKSSASVTQGSRKSGMSASLVGDNKSHSLIVRDPDNPERDVTPLSLLDVMESSKQVGGQGGNTPRSRGSDHEDSSTGNSGFAKSGWGSSGASTPTRTEDEDGDGEAADVVRAVRKPAGPLVTMLQDEFPTKPDEIKKAKEKEITVILSETQTFLLFDIPSSCVADDDEHLKKVQEANAQYSAFVKTKAGQDKYSDRAMQTLNSASKNKDAQATPAPTASIGVDATNYEIHDAIEALKAGDSVQEDDLVGSSNKGSKGEQKSLTALTGSSEGGDGVRALYESAKFKHALMAAERVVIQNIYHQQQLLYR